MTASTDLISYIWGSLQSVPSVAAITECALGSIRAHAVMVTPESIAGLSVQFEILYI